MIGYRIEKNDDGREHVVLVSPGNHEIILSSQVYRGESSAEDLVTLLQENGLDLVSDMRGPTPPDANADLGNDNA